MDWVNELKERVGVTDEGYVTDLNDMGGRELLSAENLEQLKGTTVKTDVADDNNTV